MPSSTGHLQQKERRLSWRGFLGSYNGDGVEVMSQVDANTNEWIEFVGGPFDGHRQPYQSNVSPLTSDVVWLVTEDAFRQLHCPRPIKSSPNAVLTSAALYELDVSNELPNYRYIGSVGPRMITEAIRNLN